ncbi:CHAD domain-containing protein [Pseudomonas sp. DC3200b2]|uniref:CHAD domain-containing protein n=1 Tax=Pseudomonas sp. DC3200b2 TaxID=2804669 RepID=UPI003CF24902
MAFTDDYVATILRLQVTLWGARARLREGSDADALHDLRIAVRRLRSLLVPVRKLTEMAPLREAAAEVGRLTTPSRDLEVMAGELNDRGLDEAAAHRLGKLEAEYPRIAASPTLVALFSALDQWPERFRASPLGDDPKALTRTVVKSLDKHLTKLRQAVEDPTFDRHQLRILVKRTRYLTEAFPQLSPLSAKGAKALKAVQAALGSWHDHHQWCLKGESEPDLQPLRPLWEQASTAELAQAEVALGELKAFLPDPAG